MIRKVQPVVPTSIAIFIAIIFVFSSSIAITSSFAQSDSNNSTNQTAQNMGQSTNQTGELGDADSSITEGAKKTRWNYW